MITGTLLLLWKECLCLSLNLEIARRELVCQTDVNVPQQLQII